MSTLVELELSNLQKAYKEGCPDVQKVLMGLYPDLKLEEREEFMLGDTYRNPESLGHGGNGLPEKPLYRVQFDQTHVWDRYRGGSSDKILVDIYEHWLDPIGA